MGNEPSHPALDPEDWSKLRQLGHQMLDDMFDFQQSRLEGPVWQPIPDEVRQGFQSPLPADIQTADQVYQRFKDEILPYSTGNTHARFWGWVMGNGTPLGMLADMLASGLNPNMGGGDQVPNLVELQVIDWCRQMFDFPEGSSGLLTSGGSVANLIGLAVARHHGADFDLRRDGVAAAPKPMTMYGSQEMHSSLDKAVELLGLGLNHLRKIEIDDRFRISTEALRRQLEADLAAGFQPIALIGCAGAVNTGAVDPLDELADIAEEYDLWYHIDGAFGALAYLAPELRDRLQGLSRADSLAFDLHKWFYLPFEIGCTLVRDEQVHRSTFTLRPDYLHEGARGLSGGKRWLSDYGIQLTRGFRALKAWMAFQVHGVELIGNTIHENVLQAEYLAELVEASPRLELLAPVDLNVVCFRYRPDELDSDKLDEVNEEILYRLHESGEAVPSGTHVRDRYALRCAVTNYRSRRSDFDALVEAVERMGKQIELEAD